MPFYLWEKLAPEVQRESRGTATENANKVVLECLDGFFSHVASMVVQGNKFICHVELPMAFLYAADAWVSRTWCFGMMPTFCIHSRGLFTGQDKFATGVVLEDLHPQRVAVHIVNDHDVFFAKAGDLWELPCLIGVHCLLKLVDANKYILFAFMWGWGGSVRKYVKCFLFGGAYTLSLPAHVSLLCSFKLGEIACSILDIYQGPRVVVAPLDHFEPCLFHQKSPSRM